MLSALAPATVDAATRTATIPAVFVTTVNSLEPHGGGVQICTEDYRLLLRRAGFELHTVAFEPDRRLLTRVLRRLEGRPFLRMSPPSLLRRIVTAVTETRAQLVLFNLLDYREVARGLRDRFGDGTKLIHLSQGLDSTDVCIDDQVRRRAAGTLGYDRRASIALGSKLHCEADYRRYLDACLCLSPLDAELERWLGASQTAWFSRPIREASLVMRPMNQRVGCVSTLDHPPNYHGLIGLLKELVAQGGDRLSFRLVGSPSERGKEIAARFSFVEYLGRLSDAELRSEAETWACFVHPVFDYARGCSTKLAVALGWGLPIATTSNGARGYVWDEAVLPFAKTSSQLAAFVIEGAGTHDFSRRREQSLQIAALQPTSDTLADQMRQFIMSVDAAQFV